MDSVTARTILRYDDGTVREVQDELVEEEPLEVRVRGRAISVTMRTGGHDDELAAGFLVTEGLIRSPADILRIDPCERNEFGNVVNVLLAPDVYVDFDRLTRHVFASSSCGLCGKANIEAVRGNFPPLAGDLVVDAETILRLPDVMRQTQATFDRTGGLHAAALFDAAGELLVLREDVGRHNAVDKVVGHALRRGLLPLSRHVLMLSGRASFEIMQKALAAGIPVVAAVSAPSSLAASFADDSGQTLIGFVRGRRLNIYAGRGRVRWAR
jgi:FdhD protein